MLYLFDLDGTIITSYMDNLDRAYHTWSFLPGRVEKIQRLLTEGHTVAVVTNQGGVAFGKITEADWQRKWAEVSATLNSGWRDDFDERLVALVCFSDARSPLAAYRTPIEVARRKPSPKMLQEAIARFPVAATLDVLMVGDRQEDEEAARAAGVKFEHADSFFATETENA